MQSAQNNSKQLSNKTIILLLLLLYPLGVLIMWLEKKWATWIRVLISLPIIIFILALILSPVLVTLTLIALNPKKHLMEAYQAQRSSDVSYIKAAVTKYESNGSTITSITATPTEISSSGVDLCRELVPDYIAALPTDPSSFTKGVPIKDCSSDYSTGYAISRGEEGIKVTAQTVEIDEKATSAY